MTTMLTIPPPNFLITINNHIEQHLADSNLTIKKMTRLVGMSRTDLHRKLDKTVGMSATEYIRYIRLHKAAQLLILEREWSVYQICMEVGFNDQSYFTRRFRELFGVCPLIFREEN